MDQREVQGDRRRFADRRADSAFRPAGRERRSGRDRRDGHGDRRRLVDRRHRLAHGPGEGRRHTDWAGLPPLGRLIPALVVVASSVVDLAAAQVTSVKGWSLLVVFLAFPVAAYALLDTGRWRWHLAAVWFCVGLYVMAAGFHIAWMVSR